MSIVLRARVLSAGEATGPAVVLGEGLSLWGGLDPATGRLVDAHHSQRGALITGSVLVMASGRGSSSSSSVLAEAVRGGTAPAAIVMAEPDLILAVGASVAGELYGVELPVLVLTPQELALIPDGAPIRISIDGGLTIG